MAVTVQPPKGVRHLQGLGEVYKDEDPLFCSNGSLNPTPAYSAEFIVGERHRRWHMEKNYTCRQQSCSTEIGLVFVM